MDLNDGIPLELCGLYREQVALRLAKSFLGFPCVVEDTANPDAPKSTTEETLAHFPSVTGFGKRGARRP